MRYGDTSKFNAIKWYFQFQCDMVILSISMQYSDTFNFNAIWWYFQFQCNKVILSISMLNGDTSNSVRFYACMFIFCLLLCLFINHKSRKIHTYKNILLKQTQLTDDSFFKFNSATFIIIFTTLTVSSGYNVCCFLQ